MRDKVVTVFGGSGFIGRYVIKRLADLDATIRVPTRDPNRAMSLRPMGAVGQVVLEPWEPGPTVLPRLIDGCTHVVNLIGVLAERRRGEFEAVQAQLPGEIAAAAKAAGVTRLVQISAIGADRGSPSLYARTKAEGEERARAALPEAVVMRPSIVFGPEDEFFNRFARMAQVLPVLPLIGGGRTRFQPVYVGDVATAIVTALNDGAHAGRTFELGGPTVYTFRELMEYILKIVGRRRPLVTLPFGAASLQARFPELLPEPMLTRDQVELLKRDNVVSEGALGLADLGAQPTPLETIVPGYLRAWRRFPNRLPIA
jgi:uncharacterized protein YbjT (DUF2867 family)